MLLQNISSKTLGQLVLDAVERSIDPLSGEIQVFRFLSHLYQSARDYERMTTENRIQSALRAVEAHSQTLSAIEEAQHAASSVSSPAAVPEPTPPKRSTSLPPVLKVVAAASEDGGKQIYRIDV